MSFFLLFGPPLDKICSVAPEYYIQTMKKSPFDCDLTIIHFKFKKKNSLFLSNLTCNWKTTFVMLCWAHVQGRRNRFCLGGARIIRKMTFCEFSKFLLYKSSILGGPRTPVPPPLVIWNMKPVFNMINWIHKSNFGKSLPN